MSASRRNELVSITAGINLLFGAPDVRQIGEEGMSDRFGVKNCVVDYVGGSTSSTLHHRLYLTVRYMSTRMVPLLSSEGAARLGQGAGSRTTRTSTSAPAQRANKLRTE